MESQSKDLPMQQIAEEEADITDEEEIAEEEMLKTLTRREKKVKRVAGRGRKVEEEEVVGEGVVDSEAEGEASLSVHDSTEVEAVNGEDLEPTLRARAIPSKVRITAQLRTQKRAETVNELRGAAVAEVEVAAEAEEVVLEGDLLGVFTAVDLEEALVQPMENKRMAKKLMTRLRLLATIARRV